MWAKVAIIFLLKQLAFAVDLECGVVYDASGSRIIGGTDSGDIRYPWFATLRYKLAQGKPAICAGALITTKHILTAAHCFTVAPEKPKKDLFSVALNVYDRCNETSGWETHEVTKAVAHEKYNYPADPYDIAILTLDTPSQLPRICLPPADSIDLYEGALIMGFGYTKEGGPDQPCTMQQAFVERYTQKQCSKTNLPKKDTRDKGRFCGGADGKDTCQGDSGGPFVTQGSDNRLMVSGIVSYGYGCGREGYPGVYTNVAYYLDWINGQIDGEPTETDPKSTDQSPTWGTGSQGNRLPQQTDLFNRDPENNQGNSRSFAMSSSNFPSEGRVSSDSGSQVKFPGSNAGQQGPPPGQAPPAWEGNVKFGLSVGGPDSSWTDSSVQTGPVSVDTADGRFLYSPDGRRLGNVPEQAPEQAVKFPKRSILQPRNGY